MSSVRTSVHTFQSLAKQNKVKTMSATGKTVVWPSGSLMTPVLYTLSLSHIVICTCYNNCKGERYGLIVLPSFFADYNLRFTYLCLWSWRKMTRELIAVKQRDRRDKNFSAQNKGNTKTITTLNLAGKSVRNFLSINPQDTHPIFNPVFHLN